MDVEGSRGLMNGPKPFFFGKLPDQDDFIRHYASGPDYHLLDQWLQEGLFLSARYFSSGWDKVYGQAPPYQFCLQAETAGAIMVGILWPSHDRSARKFPFVLALCDSREGIVPAMVPYAPVVYKEFLGRSGELASAGLKGLSLAELASSAGGLSAPSAEGMGMSYQRLQHYLEDTSLGEFWARQPGGFQDQGKFLLLRNLFEAFAPVLSGHSARSSLGVRFPLTAGGPFLQEDACFWVLLGSHLLRSLRFAPNVFWSIPRPGERAFLYFFINRPPSKALIPLLRPDVECDVVYRLDEDGRDAAAQAAEGLPARYRQALESSDRSLRSLLGEVMR